MRSQKLKRLLYSRADVATILGTSVATVMRLEKMGKLQPIKLTSNRGSTYYDADQVEALADREATDAS